MKMKTLPSLGPGALESVTLQLARRPYRGLIQAPGAPRPFRYRARVTGRYTVYCGTGWDHTVPVTISDEITAGDDLWDDAPAAYDGDLNAAYRIAAQLVDWSLEDWSDPCSDTDDDIDEETA